MHFKSSNHHYTWKHLNTYANGILTGRIWINIEGDYRVLNHTTKEIAQIKFFGPPSFFSNESVNKVKGIVKDDNNHARYIIKGTCHEKMESFKVLNPQEILSLDETKHLNLDNIANIIWKRTLIP